MEAQTLTIREAARRLGISESVAYRDAKTGNIRTIVIGKRKRVPIAEIDRLAGRGESN